MSSDMNSTRASNGHGVNGVSGACTPRVESGTAGAQRNPDAQEETRCPRPTRKKPPVGTGELCDGPAGASIPRADIDVLAGGLRELAPLVALKSAAGGAMIVYAAELLDRLDALRRPAPGSETLNAAIEHCIDVAGDAVGTNQACVDEHLALAGWLIELRERRRDDGWTRVDPDDRGTLPDADIEVCVRDTDGEVFRGAYDDDDMAWDVAGRFPLPVRTGQFWIDLPDEE